MVASTANNNQQTQTQTQTQQVLSERTTDGEDEEFVLPLEEQTNRPFDLALQQQRIPAWNPILDPVWVIIGLILLGITMVPIGVKIQELSSSIVELKVTYDGIDLNSTDNGTVTDDGYIIQYCGINTTYNARRKCKLEFVATEYMEPPILVHYELTNFHQNHKNYYSSKDAFQLLGRSSLEQGSLERDRCEPLNQLGDIWLNPCGLIANTFFNDIFTLLDGNDAMGNPLVLEEEGIAWATDLEYKYAQPDGFRMELCGENPYPALNENGTQSCDPNCCTNPHPNYTSYGDVNTTTWSCTIPAINKRHNNTCYRYHYPNENITQYLYETYPDVISPLEGVTNEHFVVWMRVATLPQFRKLYGYINQPIPQGERFTIEVESNYVVESFQGSKSLIVSTNNIFGGRNIILGESFVVIGFFSLSCALAFTMKHWLRPRKLADRRYLKFKEE